MIADHPRAVARPPHRPRRSPLLLPALLGTLAGLARGEPPRSVAWRDDFAQARAESQARGLPLWVQFTGPWCHNCRKMERETLADPAVVAAARDRFIPVKLRSDAYEQLALDFGLSFLPSTVILDPAGAVVARQEGYAEPGAFRRFLAEASSRAVPRRAEPAPPPSPESPDRALALDGFCPVTLARERQLVPGRPELAAVHGGEEYRFAGAEDRDAFLRDPERYAPANSGRCPVHQVDRAARVAGDPHFGVLFRGRLFLCADAESRSRFLKAPAAYAEADVADQGFCPHCRNVAGVLVRGSPRYSATHDGRRYYFPDPTHLEAFRAAPERYLR